MTMTKVTHGARFARAVPAASSLWTTVSSPTAVAWATLGSREGICAWSLSKTLPGQSDPPGFLQHGRAGIGFGPGSQVAPDPACSRTGWTDRHSSKGRSYRTDQELVRR